jgi:hypothetical protein
MNSNQSFINYEKNPMVESLKHFGNKFTSKKLKTHYVNVSSINRSVKYTFQYYSITNLITDPILFSGSNRIKIYHPDNSLDVTKSYDIILSGIVGDTINGVVQSTTCNYPLDLINFDEDTPVNIFTIVNYSNVVSTDGFYTVDDNYVNVKSDYYEIELKNILTTGNPIKSGNIGGDNITLKIIKSRDKIYENPNSYTIYLGKKFKNIVAMRLISTEIPNVSYTINVNTTDELRNNKLAWVNEDEMLTITDKVIVADHVLLNSIDYENYLNSEHINSTPGKGSDSDGTYTVADLEQIIINSASTVNQIAHEKAIITAINTDSDQQNSYCLLTDTVDSNQIIVNTSNVLNFQKPSIIKEIYKKNRYFTPKKMFKSDYFFENNYHSLGKTLVAHIEALITSKGETVIRKLLPWEYNYYKKYSILGRERYIGTNIPWNVSSTTTNTLKYLGFQTFDKLLDSSIGYSDTKFQSTSTLTTNSSTPKISILPKILLRGTEMVPQDPRDVTGITNTMEQEIYPIHNSFLEDGIYETEQLMDIVSEKLNTDHILQFDWSTRDWKKNLTLSNKFILHKNNRKRIFEIEYDRANNIIDFRQFKILPYQHSIYGKSIDENDTLGKAGLYFIVNEGYPHVCVVNKGHLFKNGSFVKLENCDNLFNINQDFINRLQPVYVNPVFEIHLRAIFPIPSETFFRVANANIAAATADKLDIHQIDSSNKATTYDGNIQDVSYKLLVELYGQDTLRFLNKGTIDNLLNYIGSKLTQNFQDQNEGYVPSTTKQFTKFKNYLTETTGSFTATEETIHHPETPFIVNELFIKYSQALGEAEELTIGRVVRKKNHADSLGNFQLEFELLTNEESNNFTVGDVIVGMESNAIAMIIPYYWNNARFPTRNELVAGYREYLISETNFNTNIPNFYWSTEAAKNKSDTEFEKKWYLKKVHNGEESFSIDVDTIPNESNIEGIENTEVEVLEPVKFAFLFGLDNTLGEKLGFKSNKEGIVDPTVNANKIDLNFKMSISNTVKLDEVTIKSTKFVKLYDNKLSNYLLVECYDTIPFNLGDKVYFENHTINKFLEKEYKAEELLIKTIYPIKDWFYSMEASFINKVLSDGQISLAANPFKVTSGSTIVEVTHANHGFTAGNKITLSGSSDLLASKIVAANINKTLSITRVIDVNTYTVTPPTVTATPDTNVSAAGGSSVIVEIEYPDTTLGSTPLVVTNGSPVVTVTHTAHTLLKGDIITFSGAGDVLADKVVAADINVTTIVTSVTDANTYTITPLITATPDSGATAGGSTVKVTHNAAAEVIQAKIINMKKWFYQNIKRWCNYDIDQTNFIIENYYYPRVINGTTQTKIHVSKLFVKETTGAALASTIFIPGMTITHSGSVIGLKVLGLTKIKHSTDSIYNEEPIKNIDEISNGSYYYIYFQRLSTVSLSSLDYAETVTYTDSTGSSNLRNASATLINIIGETKPYMEDAGVDYLYNFYLANKTILEYKTPITREEEIYIKSNNINIDDSGLKINPFAGKSYPYVAYLSYDPNNSDKIYGTTGANAGPFYVTSGSTTIKVTHPFHGLSVGDEIIITGATEIIADRVTANDLNVSTKVTKVIDVNYYNISPTLSASPDSTTYGGGESIKIELRPKSVDININAIPISTLQPGDNIYVSNHQKLIPKYYEEDDVLETDEIYLNKLKNATNDGNTDADVTNKNPNHVAGIENGVYKVLGNLWSGPKSDNYYLSKYTPGRTVLTDIEWTDDIAKGFANQGGKMRIKRHPYPIIGNNNYKQSITNELKKDSVNDDLNFELYSVLKTAVTDTLTTTVNTIVIRHGVNFRVGGLILIDPIIYSQHTESTPNHSEKNTITEMNLITAITGPDSDNDNAYTLTLQFQLLNDHLADSYIVQKGYATTMSSTANAAATVIAVTTVEYFVAGDIIIIGFNSYDSTNSEGDVGYYTEQRNLIISISGSNLTLQNALERQFTSGTYVYKMAPTIKDDNFVRHNYLPTQSVLIRGEWYTKVFYQGPDIMEDISVTDGEYSEGAIAFNKYAQKEVYISGMKGISIPELSFDDYSDYITDRTSLNSVTTKTSYNIDQITPVLDGFYTIYPNIEQDGIDYLLTDNFNIPIKGGFYTKNNSPYSYTKYWRDTGFSRQETLSANSSSLQIGTTGVFGDGSNNETQKIQAPTPTNNEHFGESVKVYENYLAVGTDKDTNGSVYIYYKNQATGVYSHQKTIAITNGGSEEQDALYNIDSRFGSYLDITDKYLAIGAPWYPAGDGHAYYPDWGRTYLYKRQGTDWVFLKKWDVNTDFSVTTQRAEFGYRITLTNDLLLIGSQEGGASNSGSGKVYIFDKNNGGTDNWGHIKTLAYPGSNEPSVSNTNNEHFGTANFIDGDYIVVGAKRAKAYDTGTTTAHGNSGLVFVYYKHTGGRNNWGIQQTIYGQETNGDIDIHTGGKFGTNVSIRGRYLLTGAPDMDDTGTNDGAAYMYYRTGTVWTIQQKIVPTSRIAGDRFGYSCSISPDKIYCTIAGGEDAEKAYVFKRTGTTWEQHSIIVPATPVTSENFGWDITYDGENILVGANGEGESGNPASQGSVYIFKQTNNTNDGNGVLSINNHTTHDLYIDGEKQRLSIDHDFTNDTNVNSAFISLGANPISTATSSGTITITHTAHNLKVGDYITISGASEVNAITAVQINVTKDIASVTDRNTYTVALSAGTADANGTDGDNTLASGTVKIQKAYTTNSIVEHSIDGWRKIYETGRQFNCILIKGKYLGYGGEIQFRDKENITDNPNGFLVKQIIYNDDNIQAPSNQFFIDLDKKQTDFISSATGQKIIPSSTLYKNLTLLESNNLFSDNHIIGTGGSIFKQVQDAPVNVEKDFMNMCITGFDTTQNTETNTIDDIFAKILLPSGSGSIYYDTFVSTPKFFYDSPLRELSELEIKFLDDSGDLIEFNGYDHSFTLEILELDEELVQMNSITGMIE